MRDVANLSVHRRCQPTAVNKTKTSPHDLHGKAIWRRLRKAIPQQLYKKSSSVWQGETRFLNIHSDTTRKPVPERACPPRPLLRHFLLVATRKSLSSYAAGYRKRRPYEQYINDYDDRSLSQGIAIQCFLSRTSVTASSSFSCTSSHHGGLQKRPAHCHHWRW